MRNLKKLLLMMLFACISINASYSQSFNWTKVINAIAIVESNNNPRAVGGGGSVGLLQITPVLVRDVNHILTKQKSSKRYTLNDRLNPEKSKEMFVIIQEHYNPSHNIEKAIRLWNGGPKYSVRGTQGYFNKVMKHYS
jgi:soluble lytic murein transglycosylase-like protein